MLPGMCGHELLREFRKLNNTPVLMYCEEHGIAVLVRGPLAQGLLSGGYTKQSVFTDSVREGWNVGGANRVCIDNYSAGLHTAIIAKDQGRVQTPCGCGTLVSLKYRGRAPSSILFCWCSCLIK